MFSLCKQEWKFKRRQEKTQTEERDEEEKAGGMECPSKENKKPKLKKEMSKKRRRIPQNTTAQETSSWHTHFEVEGRRPPGRPKKTWRKVVEEDMRMRNITEKVAVDRQQWKRLISRPTPA